jgi:hypothetical protein
MPLQSGNQIMQQFRNKTPFNAPHPSLILPPQKINLLATEAAHPVSTLPKPNSNHQFRLGTLLLAQVAAGFPQRDILQLADALARDRPNFSPTSSSVFVL